jgi:hypothetical protein
MFSAESSTGLICGLNVLTAERMRVPGGPLPSVAAARIGMAYYMDVIAGFRNEVDEPSLH